jgi:hypothetical protein
MAALGAYGLGHGLRYQLFKRSDDCDQLLGRRPNFWTDQVIAYLRELIACWSLEFAMWIAPRDLSLAIARGLHQGLKPYLATLTSQLAKTDPGCTPPGGDTCRGGTP